METTDLFVSRSLIAMVKLAFSEPGSQKILYPSSQLNLAIVHKAL